MLRATFGKKFTRTIDVVYRARRFGHRFLARLLGGSCHRGQVDPEGLDPLPLGRPTFSQALSSRLLAEPLSFPNRRSTPLPALEPYLIEPIFAQFSALLPDREVNHPLGCHRPRIPDRVVFEKLVQVLVFGCAYHRIADGTCSATTLRDRRDEWIELGVMD